MRPQRRAFAAGLAVLLFITALAGCGSSGDQVPNVNGVPLVPGAKIVTKVKQCDPGAAAFCGIQLVMTDTAYRSSEDLILGERNELHAHGWTGANGDTGEESAANSPGHKLHLTYATAPNALIDIDFGWARWAAPIKYELSRTVFDHQPALSLLLELGSQAT